MPENPDEPVWSVIRKLPSKIGEQLTTQLRAIARHNPLLKGIIDRVDFNATTHGERDIDDDRLSKLIENISEKRLGPERRRARHHRSQLRIPDPQVRRGLRAESAGEFYTPAEVGMIMARIMDPEPGMEIYDPCCGSAGLLDQVRDWRWTRRWPCDPRPSSPAQLFGQEYIAGTWAMANMNMIIHDMEGQIETGRHVQEPKVPRKGKLQDLRPRRDQSHVEPGLVRAKRITMPTSSAVSPGRRLSRQAAADWGWVQHVLASLNDKGRAAVVLDTGAASRGSGNANKNKEKQVRAWFVENDLIEGVIYLPENLFYNTSAPGILLMLNRAKPKGQQGKVLPAQRQPGIRQGGPEELHPRRWHRPDRLTYLGWKEVDKFSRIVAKAEIVKNDYNISPSRYIHTAEAEEYRPIGEIVEELDVLEAKAAETNTAIRAVLKKLGV